MNNLLNMIDTDTAWFIAAVLATIALSAFAGAGSYPAAQHGLAVRRQYHERSENHQS
jgi:hypothetical protein